MPAEQSIIFAAPMVRAILNLRPGTARPIDASKPAKWQTRRALNPQPRRTAGFVCRYGRPGDRLWVRERWAKKGTAYLYAADDPAAARAWRTPIFMPRAASRLTLGITRVRLQRLQDITAREARAEGYATREAFHEAWDSFNARRGFAWDRNPWVWAIEFRRG